MTTEETTYIYKYVCGNCGVECEAIIPIATTVLDFFTENETTCSYCGCESWED